MYRCIPTLCVHACVHRRERTEKQRDRLPFLKKVHITLHMVALILKQFIMDIFPGQHRHLIYSLNGHKIFHYINIL